MSGQEPMMLAAFDGYLAPGADTLSSVTKLGGRPGFTPIQEPAEADRVVRHVTERAVCGNCSAPMFLVAQCYCPLTEGHNRMMYVFACNKARCSARPDMSWRAFAVQCDFEDPALVDGPDEELERTPQPDTVTTECFPPVALVVEEEPEKEHIVQTDLEKEMQRVAETNANNPDIKKEDLEELDEKIDLRDKQIDIYYEKFRRRIAREPQQCLRYQLNGTALFMNPEKTIYETIPPCPLCGGPQSMELQVMPTALYFLKTSRCAPQPDGGDGTDFATVTVYSCAKACGAARGSGVHVDDLFVFVEPAPSAKDEAQAREGRMSFHDTVLGPGPDVGPLAPASASAPAVPAVASE